MAWRGDMLLLLLAALALWGLALGRDGGSLGAPLHRTHTAGAPSARALSSLRALRDVLPEDAALCASDPEERLLCSERGRFNINPFGLRFGKRQGGPGRNPRPAYPRYHRPAPAYGPKLLPT